MTAPAEHGPVRVLSRPEHNISRRDIDPDALKILYRLSRSGHRAYLVGGGVRDLLLGVVPKDFDIGTDATPEQILELFRNSRIIGRRFPIVHILFGRGKAVEVATFRSPDEEGEAETPLPTDEDSLEEKRRLEAEADALIDSDDDGDEDDEDDGDEEFEEESEENESQDAVTGSREKGEGERGSRRRGGRDRRHYDRGRHLLEFSAQIEYGTPAEDAARRDLTINGLFYDISDFSVIDYVGGLADLDARVIRGIGDPDVRFRDDPVRIIRALRHSARTGFEIEPATWAACTKHAGRLLECSKARVLEEFYRDLKNGAALGSLNLMKRSGVLGVILPELDGFLPEWSGREEDEMPLAWHRLAQLDKRILAGETFSSPLCLALLFTFPLLAHLDRVEADGERGRPDIGRVAYRFLKPLTTRLGVARRDTEQLFLISISQRRLSRCADGQPIPGFFANKAYFEDALRLFSLDAEARGIDVPEPRFTTARKRRRSRRRRRSTS